VEDSTAAKRRTTRRQCLGCGPSAARITQSLGLALPAHGRVTLSHPDSNAARHNFGAAIPLDLFTGTVFRLPLGFVAASTCSALDSVATAAALWTDMRPSSTAFTTSGIALTRTFVAASIVFPETPTSLPT